MSDVTAIPQSIITQTRDLVARRRRRRGLALAVMALPVLLLLAVTLDASAGLPAWSRLLLMLVTGVSSVGMIFFYWRGGAGWLQRQSKRVAKPKSHWAINTVISPQRWNFPSCLDQWRRRRPFSLLIV